MTIHHEATQNGTHDLRELAELWGIEVSYQAVTGERREASPDSLLAILPILGAPAAKTGEIGDALRESRQATWQRVLQPTSVVWDEGPTTIAIRLPLHQANGSFRWRIDREQGDSLTGAGQLDELLDLESATVEGVQYVQKQISIGDPLPPGYHLFRLSIEAYEYQMTLISAPTRAFVPKGQGWRRSWGVFLPLHALYSQRSWGAGDFGDLRMLSEWAHGFGASFVGTLPLLAAFLDEPFEISPYSPVSRLFWNEFFLDLRQIPEVNQSTAAIERVNSSEFRAAIEQFRAQPLVDYRRQMQLKRQVLDEVTRSFFSSTSERREKFEAYAAAHARLDDYAEFRAVGERLRVAWHDWPIRLREGHIQPEDYNAEAKRYHMLVQWLADEQLEAAADRSGGGLYLDLPLGVNASGYDVWRERDAFAVGVAGGCPPDIVFPKGQNWGFVPLHPQGIREQGYQYVRDYLRHQLRLAEVLRIDHMPSFHRVYWIAPGQQASDGVYVRYNAQELYAVFCLESHRHRTMLVGEDLGTVPPEVPEAMARHNFHRMYVVQYEVKPDVGAALPQPPGYSMASVNTHDMPPLAGFWSGSDLDERAAAGLLTAADRETEVAARANLQHALSRFLLSSNVQRGQSNSDAEVIEVYKACLAFLRDSPARMLLVNLEDLWQETRSQNLPSTAGENPNWRRKARHSFEEFSRDPRVLALLDLLNGVSVSESH